MNLRRILAAAFLGGDVDRPGYFRDGHGPRGVGWALRRGPVPEPDRLARLTARQAAARAALPPASPINPRARLNSHLTGGADARRFDNRAGRIPALDRRT